MRKLNSKNQIWYDEDGDLVRIGFTQPFLNTLDQCWHILPSNTEKFKLKAPLLTVETNDSLISIMSPVAGNFMNYSDKAQNFPDRLTEADVIMELSTKPVVRAQVARAQVADNPAARMDWAEEPVHLVDLADFGGGRPFPLNRGGAPIAPGAPRAPQLQRAHAQFAAPQGFNLGAVEARRQQQDRVNGIAQQFMDAHALQNLGRNQ